MAPDVNSGWVPLPTNNSYEIHPAGLVRSIDRIVVRRVKETVFNQLYKGRLLAQHKNKNGYLYVAIAERGRTKLMLLHRLLAQTFLGDLEGLHVNHKDGVKTNNNLSNLEILSQADNNRHSVKVLGNQIGEKNSGAKLSETQVLEIRELCSLKKSDTEIAKTFNISRATVYQIRLGKTWKHLM